MCYIDSAALKDQTDSAELEMHGSPSWTRTNDPAINSRMLYRLSY